MFKSEQEYFDNFPHDETIVRIFLKALQKQGYYDGVNIDKVPLHQMIGSPEGRSARIISLTKDSGIHESSIRANSTPLFSHEVKEGEVYITFNTMRVLSGSCVTYVMKEGEIINIYLLARS